ncbi:CCR4-NOT transcription complex subunit 1, putative, partial [Plasmodium relictum]
MNNNFNINVQVDDAALNKYEVEVNSYFAKLYTGEITVNTMLDIMKNLSLSPKGSKNNDVYKSMLLILFNECRFFPKYPNEELDVTAQLFGKLIKHNLLISYGNTLAVALKCILEALKKGKDSKMFNFGITALEQFEDSLICYPSFLSSLISIPNLRQYNAQYVIHCRNLLNSLPEHMRSLPYIDSSTILKIKHLSEMSTNSSSNINISQLLNNDVKKFSTTNANNNLKNMNNLSVNLSKKKNNNTSSIGNINNISSCSNNNNNNLSNALGNLLNNGCNNNNINNDNLLLYINDILPNCANVEQSLHKVNNMSSLNRNDNIFKNKNVNENLSNNLNLNNFSSVNNINNQLNMNILNNDKSNNTSSINNLYLNRSFLTANENNQLNKNTNVAGNNSYINREMNYRNSSCLNENTANSNIASYIDNAIKINTNENVKYANNENDNNSIKEKEQLYGIIDSFYDQTQKGLPSHLNLNNISGFGLGQIECLIDNTDFTKNIVVPSSFIVGEVFSIFNTLCLFNIDEKTKILKDVMQPEYYNW